MLIVEFLFVGFGKVTRYYISADPPSSKGIPCTKCIVGLGVLIKHVFWIPSRLRASVISYSFGSTLERSRPTLLEGVPCT